MAERLIVAHQIEALDRTFAELVDAADLEPPDDEHDPDGTTAYERAQVSSLADIARDQLRRLDQAIATVEDESFGACAHCGHPIAVERLTALPGTQHCVSCAALGAG